MRCLIVINEQKGIVFHWFYKPIINKYSEGITTKELTAIIRTRKKEKNRRRQRNRNRNKYWRREREETSN